MDGTSSSSHFLEKETGGVIGAELAVSLVGAPRVIIGWRNIGTVKSIGEK